MAANRKKIVVLLKGYPRLSETFIAQELLGLERAGFDLVLVALRRPTDAKRHAVNDEIRAPVFYLPEYLYQEPLRVLRGLGAAVRKPGFGRTFRAFLADLRRDFTPNRVRRFGQACVLVAEFPSDAEWLHAHFIHTPASVAAYASGISGIPWTVSAHAKDIWTSRNWDLSGKLGSARWAVTCTRTGYEHLQTLAGKNAGSVHLSYHGLDLDRFPHFDGARPPRDGSDEADPVTIVSVGRAVPKKGYDILLRALALLPADLHWRFVHAGDGGERRMLRKLASELRIADRIVWMGAVDQSEVIAAYRRADIFALACRITSDGDRDGLPNVLVEAASQQLTCVATDISGIPELFRNDENGLLVPPENPQVFADALAQAIRDPQLRQRLSAAAEHKVRHSFDYHASIGQLKTLFETEWKKPE